jgi:hypothetical protein
MDEHKTVSSPPIVQYISEQLQDRNCKILSTLIHPRNLFSRPCKLFLIIKCFKFSIQSLSNVAFTAVARSYAVNLS